MKIRRVVWGNVSCSRSC